jgi:hypothetical protein
MTTQPAVQPITPIYRLIVTASPLKAKQFVWVIVDDSNRSAPVQTSKQTFRSLEDAYNAGKGALEYWRDKTRRTHPSVDLAQPPQAKQPVGRPTSSGYRTSRIYS